MTAGLFKVKLFSITYMQDFYGRPME